MVYKKIPNSHHSYHNMSGLIDHLSKAGLYNQEAEILIDEISRFFSESIDQWFCSDCLLDGGVDMPDETTPCPGGCGRSYCKECLRFRKNVCACECEIDDE